MHNINIKKLKPAVPKNVLFFLAGLAWISVGIMLLHLAYSWLLMPSDINVGLLAGAGVLLSLFAHHFGFLKIVDKNLVRIFAMEDKKCLFSFIPWKSYLTIIIMISMGRCLRYSGIPKPYLAILYICIGLALVLSSIRYLRIFIREIRH